MTIYSCKGCEKRYPGCHGKCESYITEKAKHDALKEAYNKKMAIENGVTGQLIKSTRKSIKRRRGGTKYAQ